MSAPGTKKVRVNLSFVETQVSGCQLTLEIHDHWNDARKQQPYYVLTLDPYMIEYLISQLGLGLIAIEDHVKTQRRLAIATLQGDDQDA